MKLIYTICYRVLGVITVHQNFTHAFTAMYATAQADSRYLSPWRPGFNPRRFIVVETVPLGQCNHSTFTVHCHYHSTGPSLSFTYH
jgi:hypothetical protein